MQEVTPWKLQDKGFDVDKGGTFPTRQGCYKYVYSDEWWKEGKESLWN